jgi:hypothetical protein
VKERGLREYNGRGELVQSILYAFMKFSHCNSLVLLMIKILKVKNFNDQLTINVTNYS